MLRTMMTGKVHRATVTQADLHHVGSITVDEDNRGVGTGEDPAETFGSALLTRGDIILG